MPVGIEVEILLPEIPSRQIGNLAIITGLLGNIVSTILLIVVDNKALVKVKYLDRIPVLYINISHSPVILSIRIFQLTS